MFRRLGYWCSKGWFEVDREVEGWLILVREVDEEVVPCVGRESYLTFAGDVDSVKLIIIEERGCEPIFLWDKDCTRAEELGEGFFVWEGEFVGSWMLCKFGNRSSEGVWVSTFFTNDEMG